MDELIEDYDQHKALIEVLYPKSLEMQLGDKGAAPVGHSDTPPHGIHKAACLASYTPFAPMSLVY